MPKYTLEQAYKLKADIDLNTDYSSSGQHTIIYGIEIVQSVTTPLHKAFVHPFTLAGLLNRKDFTVTVDIITCNAERVREFINPLRPEEQQCIDLIKRNNARTT